MGAIAERLFGRPAAAAIEVGFAFLKFDLIRARLGNDWVLSHVNLSREVLPENGVLRVSKP